MNGTYIDIYCERTGPEFWSEPLNALTNAAFLIAAFLLARLLAGAARTNAAGSRDGACWFLTGLVFVIGVGSGLFHTLAVRWALFADIVPIAVFILVYTWFALRRFAAAPGWACTAGVLGVLAIALAVPPLTGFRGGSYVAALIAMIGIGGYLRSRRHRAGTALLAAAGLFLVSLALRTADQPVCAAFPAGTHFAWHLLNATVLYLVTRAMIRHGAAVRTGRIDPSGC